MLNCNDSSYTLKKTDNNEEDILLLKGQIDQDSLDITLLGKRRREYGEIFNENLLHLLENFASAEDSENPGNPSTSNTTGNLLENPTTGQLWYNTTDERIYHYTGTEWKQLAQIGDVAGNYGTIANGEQIPRPVSPVTGYIFSYSECSWVVSPSGYDSNIDRMECSTDSNANVTFEFRKIGSSDFVSGIANYQIIGIKSTTPLPPLPPLSISISDDIFIGTCAGQSNNVVVPSLNANLSVSGGSGQYTITSVACNGSICPDTSLSISSTDASVSYPGFTYTNCPGSSGFRDATYTFNITDDLTGENTTESLTVSWEIE